MSSTTFYYKPRFRKGEPEGYLLGIDAVEAATKEKAEWLGMVQSDDHNDPLWESGNPDMVVVSYTPLDLGTIAVEDLITKSRYLVRTQKSAPQMVRLGYEWMKPWCIERGQWSHEKQDFVLLSERGANRGIDTREKK